jgi:hypothetical protein
MRCALSWGGGWGLGSRGERDRVVRGGGFIANEKESLLINIEECRSVGTTCGGRGGQGGGRKKETRQGEGHGEGTREGGEEGNKRNTCLLLLIPQ